MSYQVESQQTSAAIGSVPFGHVAQSLVSEGARLWAAGRFEGSSFTEVVGRDIAALVVGYSCAAT